MPGGWFGVLQAAVLLLVGAGGTALVLVRDPRRQALVAAVFGLLLTLLCMVMQAPDVALSELAVGVVATPLMLLVALVSTSKPNPNTPPAERGGERR